MPEASIIWFAVAPCSAAGAERGSKAISLGNGVAEQESHAHTLPSPPAVSEQGP